MPLKRRPSSKKQQETVKNVKTLFRERLEWEGRLEDFENQYRQLVDDENARREAEAGPDGQWRRAGFVSDWELMRAFGYVSSEDEKHKRARILKEQARGVGCEEEVKVAAEQEKEFEEAFRNLQSDVTSRLPEELAWICGHPAMLRKGRSDSDKHIKITAKDLEGAPNAIAASQLNHWCNSPDVFYKLILDRLRKDEPTESVEDDVTIKDMSLSEVTMLLASVSDEVGEE